MNKSVMHKLVMHNNGFTLIELMIAVAIIGILASIAYPSYTESVRKTHRADGRIALTEAAARQERLYSETNSYVKNSDLNKLVTHSDGKSSPDGYYTLAVSIPSSPSTCTVGTVYKCFSITATAVAPQDKDTACATLSINYLGDKTSTGGGDCW